MSELLGRVLERIGKPTLVALALLALGLGSVALGLSSVIRGLDSGLLLRMELAGLLLGWWLGRVRVAGWLAALLAALLGAALALLLVGRLISQLLLLLVALGMTDLAALEQAGEKLWTGLSPLLARLGSWGWALASGAALFDPVAVALIWALGMWAIAAWAGWSTRGRGEPLQALLPAGALLAVGRAYSDSSHISLLPVLGVALMLSLLIGHRRREQHWEAARIDFSLELQKDLLLVSTPLLLALLMLATMVSLLPIGSPIRAAQRLLSGQATGTAPLADSLGLQPRPRRPAAPDERRAPGLPRNHLIGASPELLERPVMVVRPSPASSPPPPARYYWRSLTYDRYTGRGWLTDSTQTTSYAAGQPAQSAALPGRRSISQQVQLLGEQPGQIYAAGTLLSLDQPYRIAWRAADDIFGVEAETGSYTATSLVVEASEAQLRRAGRRYPEPITQRYLALPELLPARVYALARDLTATAPTPYDAARAIETYLRSLPYSLELPAPPGEREVVDYFLFDLRKGYCDYYATAMAVLARAAGLPARLVVGYASGAYDAAGGRYLVTEADAHSWVEIYFPGYGWVEFEPTAARPLHGQPASLDASAAQAVAGLAQQGSVQPAVWRARGLSMMVGLGLIGAAAAGWLLLDRWRLRQLPPAVALATLYQRLQRHGRRLAVPGSSSHTPYEYAQALARRLQPLASSAHGSSWLGPAADEAQWLVARYVESAYSPHPIDPAQLRQALVTWRRLRRRLWLARIWPKEQRP